MSDVLARWNGLPQEEAAREILACCGSKGWAESMALKRPILDEATLLTTSDAIWRSLTESDWLDAFQSHPRIGETRAEKDLAPQSSAWSEQEQQKAAAAEEALKTALKWGNREYEQSSAVSSLLAPREKPPANFWRFFAAGCTMMKQPNCNRPPRSSVRSCASA